MNVSPPSPWPGDIGSIFLSEEQIQTTDYSGQLWRITERDRSIAMTVRAKW